MHVGWRSNLRKMYWLQSRLALTALQFRFVMTIDIPSANTQQTVSVGYRNLRIENTLTDEQGDDVKLKKGARVDVSVAAKDASLPSNPTSFRIDNSSRRPRFARDTIVRRVRGSIC